MDNGFLLRIQRKENKIVCYVQLYVSSFERFGRLFVTKLPPSHSVAKNIEITSKSFSSYFHLQFNTCFCVNLQYRTFKWCTSMRFELLRIMLLAENMTLERLLLIKYFRIGIRFRSHLHKYKRTKHHIVY